MLTPPKMMKASPKQSTNQGRMKSAPLTLLLAQIMEQVGMAHLVSVDTSLLAMSRMKSATLILYGSL